MSPASRAAGSIKFPKVQIEQLGKGAYKAFLATIYKDQCNQGAFALTDKAVIDKAFEGQLRNALQDESLVQRYMREEARTSQAAKYLEKQHKLLQRRGPSPVKVSEDIAALKLPKVCRNPKNSKYDVMKGQTYSDFATKAEKNNPNFAFTKETMDSSFELAASQTPFGAGGGMGYKELYSQMMSRCLGKESSEYWKKRKS